MSKSGPIQPYAILVLWMVVALTLGGCGVPRMVGFHARIHDSGLVIPEGTRGATRVQPDVVFLYSTGSTTRIHSARLPRETFEWYRADLAQQGWQWDEESLKAGATILNSTGSPRAEAGVWNFIARRTETWKLGAATIPIRAERIDLHIDMGYSDEEPTGCYVTIELAIQTIWDLPSRLMVGLVLTPATLVLQEGVLMLQPLYIWF